MLDVELVPRAALNEWLAVRRDVYLEAGLIEETQLVGGEYRDQYDEYSLHVLARVRGDAAGSARLIMGTPGQPLQVQHQFDLDVPSGSAEISGFGIAPSERNSAVWLALVKAVMTLAREHGANWVYAVVEDWFLEAIQKDGFPMVAVTDKRWLYNTWNVVARASVQGFWDQVERQSRAGQLTPMVEYMALPMRWREHPARPAMPEREGRAGHG